MSKKILMDRVVPALMYFIITFSVGFNWVVSVIIDFVIYLFVKNKKIKLHALQAVAFGVIAIIFMSVFGFVLGVFAPESSGFLTNAASKIIGALIGIVGIGVLIGKELRLKIIEDYI
jgi:hypothetical protein